MKKEKGYDSLVKNSNQTKEKESFPFTPYQTSPYSKRHLSLYLLFHSQPTKRKNMNLKPLHLCHFPTLEILINRSHIFLHSTALLFLIYYRLHSSFFQIPTLPWLLLFSSELLLSFIWLLGRPSQWRPVSRTVFIENLPADDRLPAIDVFICTADPEKEPCLEVMNTVISAMALDYPANKLHVYLSDDGGSPVTLDGMREVRKFVKWWIPFCRKYGVVQRCPAAYFSAAGEDDRRDFPVDELLDKKLIKEKYEEFKTAVTRGANRCFGEAATSSCGDHPPFIEVIKPNYNDEEEEESGNQIEVPLLIYVSREKKPSQPHHFKAGALNVLLRVSSTISNSPYILVLDCDMYCNDPTSARQAMCFHVDPDLSPSLAFVQFPQKFHTVSKNDIYDSQLRSLFTVEWHGMDGLRGPVVSGTGFFMKRLSLYGTSPQDTDVFKHKEDFGVSKEFIKSLGSIWNQNVINGRDFPVKETEFLASCSYENGSQWGQKVGFLYDSVVEDYFTSFKLHCKGWKSVYCDPQRPQFLGSGTTILNEVLVQGTRWYSGLLEVGISRFCPLFYGSKRMSLLQSMKYAELAFSPLYCLPLWCFATVPQLCLLHGIPIYPKVSSSFFIIYCFIFVSSLSKHLHEVLISGKSVKKWINEQRIWMMKSITCFTYGSLDALMKKIGQRNASFVPTNKVVDNEQIKRYNMDIFDFQASTMFLAPMATLVLLNLVSFTIGIGRVLAVGNWEEMFGQIFLSFYILLMSFPIIEAMVVRFDKGCFPFKVTLSSMVVVMVFLYLLWIVSMYL